MLAPLSCAGDASIVEQLEYISILLFLFRIALPLLVYASFQPELPEHDNRRIAEQETLNIEPPR
jgi:hypothetical protein